MSAVILVGSTKHVDAQKRNFREAGFNVREASAMHLGRGIWIIRVDLDVNAEDQERKD